MGKDMRGLKGETWNIKRQDNSITSGVSMWKEVEHVILAPEKVIDEIVDVFYIFHVSDTLSSPSMVFYSFSSFYWSFLRPDSQSLAKRRKAHNRKKLMKKPWKKKVRTEGNRRQNYENSVQKMEK